MSLNRMYEVTNIGIKTGVVCLFAFFLPKPVCGVPEHT